MTRGSSVPRLALLAAVALLLPAQGSAQSDILLRVQSGVSPGDRMRVDSAGGFVVLGNLGLGITPASGAGSRMMWDPFHNAFRAGRVEGSRSSSWDNANLGFYSWAGGHNTLASGLASFAMGERVEVTEDYSVGFGADVTISGGAGFAAGSNNRCAGNYCHAVGFSASTDGLAAIALGWAVTANASHSVAIGRRATTNGHAGAFVYGDASTTTDSIVATGDNEFAVRAAGGYRFRTNAALTTGCNLPPGSGTFVCTSTRAAKENYEEVDGEALLERIRAVPLNSWNLIEEPGKPRHMGPFAEDFHAAFGLGSSETSIGHQDIDGVNFGGVKALEVRTRSLQEENRALSAELSALREEVVASRREIADLRQRLEAVEAAARR